MEKIIKNSFGNFLKICIIFLIMTGWIFSGWPQVWQNPPIPPKIKKVDAADTGFNNPSNFVDGGWNDEANAYSNDSAWATTGTSATVTSEWTNFSFSGLTGASITSICVRIVGHSNQVQGKKADLTDIELSYDGGTNWTNTTNIVTDLNKDSDATYYLPSGCDSDGGDDWNRTWTDSEFSNANFQIKITGNSTEKSTLNGELNEVAVKVTYAASLSLNLDSATKSLGNITPGTQVTATTTATVTTSNANGYSLKISDSVAGSDSTLLHTDTVTRIADYAGTIATPTIWSGTGLGICSYAADTNKEAKWGTGTTETDSNNKYAGIPQNSTEIHNVGTSITDDNTSIGYKLDVPSTRKTGVYSGDVTYTAVVNP